MKVGINKDQQNVTNHLSDAFVTLTISLFMPVAVKQLESKEKLDFTEISQNARQFQKHLFKQKRLMAQLKQVVTIKFS